MSFDVQITISELTGSREHFLAGLQTLSVMMRSDQIVIPFSKEGGNESHFCTLIKSELVQCELT